MKKYLIILFVFALAPQISEASVFSNWWGKFMSIFRPAPVACTLEAKQCPDGSYVGRQGPKCEFAACPKKSGIIDAIEMNIEDFLLKYRQLSKDNTDFIKEIGEYDIKDAWGKGASWISYINDGGKLYLTDSRKTSLGLFKADVYEIDLDTGAKNRIFSNRPDNFRFYLVGKQGRNLLLERTYAMNSPGPCYSPWIFDYEYPESAKASIKSLNIDNPNQGFDGYEVSKEKYEQSKKGEEKCNQDLK